MPEKDPTIWTSATWILFFVTSLVGALTGWYRQIKEGHVKSFSLAAFVGELGTSFLLGYVGFVTADYFGFDIGVAAGIGGMSAHFSTRLLFSTEGIIHAAGEALVKRIEAYGRNNNDKL